MFDSLRRLTQGPDGLPKIPFIKQDMDRIMEKITADIDTLEVAFTSATRIHADACLLASEGGLDEGKARDRALAKFVKAERALADARAAHTAAERRKAVDAEKDKAKELAERQKRVAALQKKVAATCKTLDDLLDQVAAEAITLRDETTALRLEGVRDAQTPLVNLNRALGSRLRRSNIDLGKIHPFDEDPIKLVGLAPDLSTAVAAVGPKR
jgi:hypothetical protein